MKADLDLYTRLASIGINVAIENKTDPFTDIEKTILLAAENIKNDKRLISLILSWVKIHGERINIERMKKIACDHMPAWISLIAVFAVFSGQTRWKILTKKVFVEPYANGDIELTQSLIRLRGEEPWSEGSGFLIPKNSITINDKFVLNPFQLAKVNNHYRNKLIYGSNWRADIITAIQLGAKNPTEASRISSSSYEPAYRAFYELKAADVLDSILQQCFKRENSAAKSS